MPPQERKPLKPKIVLGIAAHPDDLDFMAAGSLAAFAKDGASVYYLILTDGGKGSADRSADSKELQKIRESEQQTALAAIGGARAEFLGYPDGALLVTLELKRDIVRVIRKIKPDVVVTVDPGMLYSADRGFINHPDHRAAGQAALDAIFPLARDHLSFPELIKEGLEPHNVATVLLSNFEKQNFVVDISETLEQKFNALAAHASQIPDMEQLMTWMRQEAAKTGKPKGYTYGEAFVRIDIR